ncbi:NUMOD3 domain-containing DNA-binding protein [Polynucleobacter sp. AP-Nickl1-40-C4]|jgi:hypothetical protein|uniref:NUMOD3 domain-containing DNA-binding protein n=1 Tax=Polynucleobacter sp. AP-Nickl1-40-C4 TaxID=3108275 RepID=UPI002B236DEC|nr:NUMOD3 domain-containing DNA-binding protein [Polynucleobacter sp. AP-Nickl1-40-C4]MEA9567140.1 NUMOD3 domain-containing DNA-binding protein [Polynucleobacter sp. AP-Nickl1-40-C4]
MNFYTYAHKKPDGSIFYIGQGSAKYDRAHSTKGRNKYWHNVVNKYGYEVEILAYWNTSEEAKKHEVELISYFKGLGVNLVNMTEGGEGTVGFFPSEETRKKLSEIQKKLQNSPERKAFTSRLHTGRKRPEETKQKMSQAMRGNINGEGGRGRSFSDDHIANLSSSHKGYVMPEEQKAKIRESTKKARAGIKTLGMTGRKHSPETLEKMRLSAKAREAKKKELGG